MVEASTAEEEEEGGENEKGGYEEASRLVVVVEELVPLAAHGVMNTTFTSAILGTIWRRTWANV